MAVGVVGLWNTYTTASTKWTDADGTTCKRKMKGLHQRAFTVDALLIFNFGSEIGWYARYSPMHIFHHSTGLNTRCGRPESTSASDPRRQPCHYLT